MLWLRAPRLSIMFTSSYDPRNQPLFHVAGYPVRLALLLVLIHVLMLIATSIVGGRMNEFLGMTIHRSLVDDSIVWPSWWQWGTYIVNHMPGTMFLLDMLYLGFFGTQLERVMGRRFLAVLYGALIALPSLLVLGGVGSGIWSIYGLFGTGSAHFCLFMAIAFLYPNVCFWITPIKIKWIAAALFTMYILQYLYQRNGLGCLIHVANTSMTYVIMRRFGLTPRFERVAEAFSAALPRPRKKTREALPYTPKMVPRPELREERVAVAKIDSILEKISRSGLDSLTADERTQLERASTELKRQDG